ncbi:hypothetical protein F66182_3858 [Fusarium sp. NRRL 66182]|nr:hypothetical protein F66182_3858 [Fusarium sp. NRRL 66182]
MEPPGLGYAESGNEPGGNSQFQFITIQTPHDLDDRATRRLARSHAVKQGLQNKRRLQQESMGNFRVLTLKDKQKRSTSKRKPAIPVVASPFSLSASILDPFQTLAVDSSRLQALLGDWRVRHAPEPVFSIVKDLAFQSFRSVFRAGFVDPDLLNAVMFSFAFAANGCVINRECLQYQGQAIRYIRERMSSLDKATPESTIGAILLLVGVEVGSPEV